MSAVSEYAFNKVCLQSVVVNYKVCEKKDLLWIFGMKRKSSS